MNTDNTELGSEKDKTENQLPQEDTNGAATQNVNGSKDAKTGKPFVPNKPLPGDEIVRQH